MQSYQSLSSLLEQKTRQKDGRTKARSRTIINECSTFFEISHQIGIFSLFNLLERTVRTDSPIACSYKRQESHLQKMRIGQIDNVFMKVEFAAVPIDSKSFIITSYSNIN